MTILRMYQIDAFTRQVFSGNPAAVCPLDAWPDDRILQAIALENNLSETAFFAPEGDGFRLRWFTPVKEVSLCGHATLASAFVIFSELDVAPVTPCASRRRAVHCGSGETLRCWRWTSRPGAWKRARTARPPAAGSGQRTSRGACRRARPQPGGGVRGGRRDPPDPTRLCLSGEATSWGSHHGPREELGLCVALFLPDHGIPEDPVTGSIHCALVPYWAQRLGKRHIHARQVSQRGGELFCEDRGERVEIAGYAVKYMEGVIHV